MLLSKRCYQAPELGLALGEHMALHSRYRVHVKTRSGLIADDALFGGSQRPLKKDRSQLVISLTGETLLRTASSERIVRAGEFVTERHSNRYLGRHEGEVKVLIVEWEPGMLGTRLTESTSAARLCPVAVRRLRELAAPLIQTGTSPAQSAAVIAEIVELMRAEGIPFDPVEPEDLVEELPPYFAPLSRALDNALTSLVEQPSLLDLERVLGLSERQVQRQLLRFNEHYTIHASGRWRDLIRWWRLPMGATLMSTPKATTEGVARMLGYASARAFCDAFAAAGLPSPGAIRSTLRQLA